MVFSPILFAVVLCVLPSGLSLRLSLRVEDWDLRGERLQATMKAGDQ